MVDFIFVVGLFFYLNIFGIGDIIVEIFQISQQFIGQRHVAHKLKTTTKIVEKSGFQTFSDGVLGNIYDSIYWKCKHIVSMVCQKNVCVAPYNNRQCIGQIRCERPLRKTTYWWCHCRYWTHLNWNDAERVNFYVGYLNMRIIWYDFFICLKSTTLANHRVKLHKYVQKYGK